MSLVEVHSDLRKKYRTICLSADDCVRIYNPKYNFTWDAQGNLVEIRVEGEDEDGETVAYRRTFTWDAQGNLVEVGKWEEV